MTVTVMTKISRKNMIMTDVDVDLDVDGDDVVDDDDDDSVVADGVDDAGEKKED